MKTPENYGPINPRFPRFLHGGDYSPEQWIDTPGVWEEDMRLMKLAHCNALSVGIFSWVMLEPEEGRFEFGWLDRVLEMLAENDACAVLATPSGSKPAWMSRRYPEVRRVGENGLREPHRGRHNHCRTSPVYREKCRTINTKLAERYKEHPALLVWHVSNEYNGEPCHCELCYAAFREWLKARYGTLEALNEAWWAAFWGHRFTDWDLIEPVDDSIHGMMLDWRRFSTDQTVDFFRDESAPLRELTPDVPVIVNMMGLTPTLNYWKFAPYVDAITWDSYPCWHQPGEDWRLAATTGFVHDLNRSMKGGRPFLLMESTPSMTNWQPVGRPKRPGMHKLSSLQAVAHGADSVQYFQWRKSRGSAEKFHGAVVDHCGHDNNRVFREVAEVGRTLEQLDPVIGTSVAPEVAIVFDQENRWAYEMSKGPRNIGRDHPQECIDHYRPFWKRGIPVDVIDQDCDFGGYRLLIAPVMYMVREGVGERIAEFVRGGGTFVATYLSGIVNESDLCYLGGFPGPLRATLGVWAEETDALHDGQSQAVNAAGAGIAFGLSGEYEARELCDVLHLEGAEALATFGEDYYAGRPAVTVNRVGDGAAYYVASRNDDRFYDDFYRGIETKLELERALEAELPEGVTAQLRADGQRAFVFVQNFSAQPRTVELGDAGFSDLETGEAAGDSLELGAYGCRILERAGDRQ